MSFSSSGQNGDRKIVKKFHIRKYQNELNGHIFMTDEHIDHLGAHVAAWILWKHWNTHVALIIYPMKYYYNNEGCFMTRIDITEDRELKEWYEYPLRKVTKLPEDEKEHRDMRNAFYNNFQTLKKTWTKDNYSWRNRNCQHFMKILYEKSTGRKLPADIRKFVYCHDRMGQGFSQGSSEGSSAARCEHSNNVNKSINGNGNTMIQDIHSTVEMDLNAFGSINKK